VSHDSFIKVSLFFLLGVALEFAWLTFHVFSPTENDIYLVKSLCFHFVSACAIPAIYFLSRQSYTRAIGLKRAMKFCVQ
jgi:hypothetical protein